MLRFTSPVSGSRREMGLGGLRRESLAAAGESLAAVRNAAEDARRLLSRNLDPIDDRDREAQGICSRDGSGGAAAIGGRVTLRRYTREYHKKHVEPVRGFKHARQWINSIEQHVPCPPPASEKRPGNRESRIDGHQVMHARSG